MQSVKRFLARGKVQAPFTDTSDPPRWRQVGLRTHPWIQHAGGELKIRGLQIQMYQVFPQSCLKLCLSIKEIGI